jgi:hypothetical protein
MGAGAEAREEADSVYIFTEQAWSFYQKMPESKRPTFWKWAEKELHLGNPKDPKDDAIVCFSVLIDWFCTVDESEIAKCTPTPCDVSDLPRDQAQLIELIRSHPESIFQSGARVRYQGRWVDVARDYERCNTCCGRFEDFNLFLQVRELLNNEWRLGVNEICEKTGWGLQTHDGNGVV